MKRAVSIDILKGIGILSVIYIHMGITNLFSQYVSSFHMILFFFASGYCYKSGAYFSNKKLFILKKAKALLYPYFVWSIVNFFLNCLLQIKSNTIDIKSLVENIFLSYLNFGAIWFIPSLFICILVSVSIIDRCKGKLDKLLFATIITILGVLFSRIGIFNNYFRWMQGFLGALGFVVGYVVKGKNILRIAGYPKVVLGLALIVSGALLSYYNGLATVSRMTFGKCLLFFYISALMSCIGWLFISDLLSKYVVINKALSFLGTKSIYILITHQYVLFFCGFFVKGFLLFLSTLTIEIFICLLFDKSRLSKLIRLEK